MHGAGQGRTSEDIVCEYLLPFMSERNRAWRRVGYDVARSRGHLLKLRSRICGDRRAEVWK